MRPTICLRGPQQAISSWHGMTSVRLSKWKDILLTVARERLYVARLIRRRDRIVNFSIPVLVHSPIRRKVPCKPWSKEILTLFR